MLAQTSSRVASLGRRSIREVVTDSLLGAATGGMLASMLAVVVVIAMVLNRSVTIPMRHGVTIHGGGLVAAFLAVGIVSGASMATFRGVMLRRAGAFAMGSGCCALLGYLSLRFTSGLPRTIAADVVVVGVVSVVVGGYAGLQIRKGMMHE